MVSGSRPNAAVDEPLVYVDTHCHLDDESIVGDLPEVLDGARRVGVTRWINIGFNPERWDASIDLGNRIPGMSIMLGVHPGDADRWNDQVQRKLGQAVDRFGPVGIGETGLDFFRGETNAETQIRAFQAQLDLAKASGIPAAIHMRSAEPLMLEVLQARRDMPSLLFHSFDGSRALTDWVVANGAHVGVGGLATRSKSTALRQQLKRIPLEQIVLETDTPHLVPNGFKHRRNTPESIPIIASFLADLLEVGIEDVSRQTTKNAVRLFEGLRPA